MFSTKDYPVWQQQMQDDTARFAWEAEFVEFLSYAALSAALTNDTVCSIIADSERVIDDLLSKEDTCPS